MASSYAIVVIRSGNEHHDEVALNYTQLSLDYQRTNRVQTDDIVDFYVQDVYEPMHYYDCVLVIQAGTIFLWGAYEHFYKPDIDKMQAGYIHLSDTVFVHKPAFNTTITFPAKYIHVLDTRSAEDFWSSHDALLTSLIDDSNITYLMHNEIPVLGDNSAFCVDWAVTVSSGFFINYLLDHHCFTKNTVVHHVDISKISLQVHRYTIKNWDGKDWPDWMQHLNEKFISMGLWNRRKFTQEDKRWPVVWKHVQDYFGDRWLDHWQQYCDLEHEWHRTNIKYFDFPQEGQGVAWWNGALKRLPSNLCKTSEQSYQGAIDFLGRLPANTICYGSDHCDTQFDGTPAEVARSITRIGNSRDMLWL